MDPDPYEEPTRRMLLSALRWIASEPADTIAGLTFSDGTGRVPPSEVALTLEDAWIPVRDYRRFTPEIRSSVQALYDVLAADEPEAWTDAAIATHPMWADARARARALLDALGEPQPVGPYRDHLYPHLRG